MHQKVHGTGKEKVNWWISKTFFLQDAVVISEIVYADVLRELLTYVECVEIIGEATQLDSQLQKRLIS